MESIRKFIKRFQRKKIIVCPKCGNHKIDPLSPLNGWVTSPQYICGVWGYADFVVV
ncbi:MAG: hypothetical protein N3E48_02990 [Candidatus Bathyarchaeota archaeon]|nr:hypothetical protein [Candidatus Bathyarchaeota archaeon]